MCIRDRFCTSYFTLSDNLDVVYERGMYRPGLLNADAVGVLTYGEGLSCAAVLSLDHGSFKYLDSLAVTLFDLVVDLNGIANVEFRYGSL